NVDQLLQGLAIAGAGIVRAQGGQHQLITEIFEQQEPLAEILGFDGGDVYAVLVPVFGDGDKGPAIFMFRRCIHHDEGRDWLTGCVPPYPEVTAEAGITGNRLRAGAVKAWNVPDPLG